MEPNDEELVRACLRGDETAWEALVRRYQRLVYTVPRRAGLDEDASADVFQEVFATLLESLERIEQPSRLHAWLVTTARRKTWLAVKRAQKGRGFVTGDEGDDEAGSIPEEGPSPEESLGELEQQHLVRVALSRLEERCRQLLTMLFYSAEPPAYADVAAALGTSEGSIGPTRARCLKKLLAELKKLGLFSTGAP